MHRLRLATIAMGVATCAPCCLAGRAVLAQEVTAPRLAPHPRLAFDGALQLHDGPIVIETLPLEPMERPPSSRLVMRDDPRFVRTALVAVGASAVLSLGDAATMREIARFRSPDGAVRTASVVFASLGGGVPLSVGAILWAGGAVSHHDALQTMGAEATQAVALSGALTIGIKGLVGRSRPNAAPDDPDVYHPGRGFFNSARASFPSGHTSAAFAVATVLSKEMSARYPGKRWLIRSVLYGAAGSVGVARMYQNAHWPSDVATGAALGTLSGLQVLAWNGGRR